ncbi:DUF4062 domain-containing protein [Pararoseomonas sp. SCSIO 73927]|uniref:DUF4062 domain-containing protein n=1 Tax=Pararoseomonas sp. SCSIO 73927 TaxID=3114537 RepID=UPI0030CA839E
MRIFVSSPITGHEDLRAAVMSAIRGLGHEVICAEDFPAMASSPQVACLDGVRASDAVVLILAERYGARQASGKSATHEEFLVARDTRPVFAFVRNSRTGTREPEQDAFVREVQAWVDGLFTQPFQTPDDLREVVTRAIHQWELSRARVAVDPAELLERATGLLPRQSRHYHHHGVSVAVGISGGPRQSVLRPARLEDPALADRLQQLALFGPSKFFTTRRGTEHGLKGSALEIGQERGASFSVDELGGVRVIVPLESDARGAPQALVEEDVSAAIRTGLQFGATILEEVDPTRALRQIVPVVTIQGASYHPWMRRAEVERSNGGMSMRMGSEAMPVTHLTPPERSRAALVQELDVLVEDLTTLLRRAYRTER